MVSNLFIFRLISPFVQILLTVCVRKCGTSGWSWFDICLSYFMLNKLKKVEYQSLVMFKRSSWPLIYYCFDKIEVLETRGFWITIVVLLYVHEQYCLLSYQWYVDCIDLDHFFLKKGRVVETRWMNCCLIQALESPITTTFLCIYLDRACMKQLATTMHVQKTISPSHIELYPLVMKLFSCNNRSPHAVNQTTRS